MKVCEGPSPALGVHTEMQMNVCVALFGVSHLHPLTYPSQQLHEIDIEYTSLHFLGEETEPGDIQRFAQGPTTGAAVQLGCSPAVGSASFLVTLQGAPCWARLPGPTSALVRCVCPHGHCTPAVALRTARLCP